MTPQAAGAIAAGAVVAGGTGVGAYMLATSSAHPTTLEEYLNQKGLQEENKTKYTTTGKLGSEVSNQKLLVADVEVNMDWWNKRYADMKEQGNSSVKLRDAESQEFKAVTKGYGTTNDDSTKALNRVCDSVYQKNKTDFTGDTGETRTKANLKADVEKFCTLKGEGNLKVD
ncbi:hypothetical protein [Candidatus Mycoplasma haematohominis]|uniref:hypothetical protein n=1 Tax=Candidatus Mycoplasma haematohominis TaxID=1494318 RepID=UPI001C0A7390|nr:hypothetical protein [Candidatus Mycoplasma haemohominis]